MKKKFNYLNRPKSTASFIGKYLELQASYFDGIAFFSTGCILIKRSGKGTTTAGKTKLFANSKGKKKNKVNANIFILNTYSIKV